MHLQTSGSAISTKQYVLLYCISTPGHLEGLGEFWDQVKQQ
jgi:hypothetical protein